MGHFLIWFIFETKSLTGLGVNRQTFKCLDEHKISIVMWSAISDWIGLVYLFRLVWSFSLPYIHSFTASCNYLKLPNRWMEFGSTHRRQRALIQHVPFHVLLVFQPIGRKFSSPPRFLSTSTRLETCITTITPPDQR